MTTEMHVAVMVPDPVSPTWLYELGRPVVELFAPVGRRQGPVLCVRELTVDRDPRMLAYCQRRVRWPIPPVVAGKALWEVLASLRPLAARIVAGMAPPDELNGPDPELTPDAQAAAAQVQARLAEAVEGLPLVEAVPSSAVAASAITDVVSADTTDEGLADITARLAATVPASAPEVVVYVEGLAERVERARALARKQVRGRLAAVAALAESGRRERDELIRRIAAWRDDADTHRSLGAAAGLSHGAVQKIIAKHDKGDGAMTASPEPGSVLPYPHARNDCDLCREIDADFEIAQEPDLSRTIGRRRRRFCQGCIGRWIASTAMSRPDDVSPGAPLPVTVTLLRPGGGAW